MSRDSNGECAICGGRADGTAGFDEWTDAMRVPACQACGAAEVFIPWFEKALKILRESPIACVSQGNIALDLREVEAALRSESMMQDGICPNGCARMVRFEESDEHTQKCPSCGFIGWQNTPIKFPYDA